MVCTATVSDYKNSHRFLLLIDSVYYAPVADTVAKSTAKHTRQTLDVWVRMGIFREVIEAAIEFSRQRRVGPTVDTKSLFRENNLIHRDGPLPRGLSCQWRLAFPPGAAVPFTAEQVEEVNRFLVLLDAI